MTAVLSPAPRASGTARTTVLRAEEVVRRYRNGRGVGPVSITAAAGECVGLMGPNGAGKSTLLRLLATVDRPQRGRIIWLDARSPRQARQHLGYAPDVVMEEGWLTARQTTYFWCRQWRAKSDSRDRVELALARLGLLEVADEPVRRFSFGMRRRLALAQAVVHDPALLLLDEPTAGLDPAGVECLRSLLAARAAGGATTVVASNDCDFAAQACDTVVFIDAGRVLRGATPQALLAETGRARLAELEVVAACDLETLRAISGTGSVQQQDGMVSVQLLDAAALPRVVACCDSPSGNLRGLRLRVPDLSDAFWQITGRALGEGSTAR